MNVRSRRLGSPRAGRCLVLRGAAFVRVAPRLRVLLAHGLHHAGVPVRATEGVAAPAHNAISVSDLRRDRRDARSNPREQDAHAHDPRALAECALLAVQLQTIGSLGPAADASARRATTSCEQDTPRGRALDVRRIGAVTLERRGGFFHAFERFGRLAEGAQVGGSPSARSSDVIRPRVGSGRSIAGRRKQLRET